MMRFVQQWDTWWTRSVPPHALALIRIGFGAYLIFYWCLHLPRVDMLFSAEGLVVPVITETMFLGGWVQPMSVFWTYVIYFSLLPCIALFMLGWDMRTNAFIIILFGFYYWHLSFHLYPNTYHRLYLFLLIVLAFSGADRTLSLRMKKEKGSWTAWEPISIWPMRLIALQLTATFVGVSFQKLWLPAWQDNAVLFYPFIGRWGTSFGAWVVQQDVWTSMRESNLFFFKITQCLLPFGFWIPKVRVFAIAGASLFLLGVSTMLSIWWFLILIPCFIVFFPPERVQRQLNYRLTKR